MYVCIYVCMDVRDAVNMVPVSAGSVQSVGQSVTDYLPTYLLLYICGI